MALIKTAKTARTMVPASAPGVTNQAPAAPAQRTKPGPAAQASERVAVATEEFTRGLVQATAAAEELRRVMEQIAAGSNEAASASQEQLAAMKSVVLNLGAARGHSETSRRRTEVVQSVLAETAAQITASALAIEKNAERQQASVAVIAELERRAQEIGDITRSVSRISDRTNLLALNAAIEAARAGDHGRGFAVVADEVQALAEAAEKNAQDVQRLVGTIQNDVRNVVQAVRAAAQRAAAEAKSAATVVEGLDAVRAGMRQIVEGSDSTLAQAMEMERAATEAQRGCRTGGRGSGATGGRGGPGPDGDPSAVAIARARADRCRSACPHDRGRQGGTGGCVDRRADRSDGRGTVGDSAAALQCGKPDHGGGRPDQSRLPAAGGGHP